MKLTLLKTAGQGRKRETDLRQDKKIVRAVLKDRIKSSTTRCKKLRAGVDLSPRTVIRGLVEFGLKSCKT